MAIQDELNNIKNSLSKPSEDSSAFVSSLMTGMVKLMSSLEIKDGKVLLPGAEEFLASRSQERDSIILSLTVYDIHSFDVKVDIKYNANGKNLLYKLIILDRLENKIEKEGNIFGDNEKTITHYIDDLKSGTNYDIFFNVIENDNIISTTSQSFTTE